MLFSEYVLCTRILPLPLSEEEEEEVGRNFWEWIGLEFSKSQRTVENKGK